MGFSGADATISKVSDINKITDYGVMITPDLVLDSKVKVTGKIPTPEAIAEWLKQFTLRVCQSQARSKSSGSLLP